MILLSVMFLLTKYSNLYGTFNAVTTTTPVNSVDHAVLVRFIYC